MGVSSQALNGPGHRSMAEIVQDILATTQEILRSEIRLAKVEATEEAIKAGKAAGLLGGACLLGFYAGALLIAASVAALSLVMPFWLAALLIGIMLLCIGYWLLLWGRDRLRQVHPVPQRTTQTIKDDVAWLKSRTT